MKLFVEKHLSKICVGIATATIIAVASAFWDTKTLKVEVKNHETRILTVEEKIDDIHWYLIEKNNIKVPKRFK